MHGSGSLAARRPASAVSSLRPDIAGNALMREAIHTCAVHFPGQSIALSAQSHLERFYRSFGFAPTSEEYVEDGIPHIDMQRPADHLGAVPVADSQAQ